MAPNNKISVEVAFAASSKQKIIALDVDAGSTIQSVIQQSAILTVFPEIDLAKQKVGIFGKIKSLSDTVKAGDRIEIYRPLTIDPKEARRAKAKKTRSIKR
jgi:uncharacterized protein